MKAIAILFSTILAAAAFVGSPAFAAVGEDVAKLQHEWERIKYQMPPAEQEKEFARLAGEAEKAISRNPNRAEVLIWHGIIEASQAGAKGGLGALSLVKDAKKSLERALEINPDALDGSAYTSLGSLYYQVPGWPIGFGDDKKAAELLKKGLAANPDGIDPNYFYGDFLYRSGDLENAERVLRKALAAPARNGRKLSDEGRRREITQLLEKITDGRR